MNHHPHSPQALAILAVYDERDYQDEKHGTIEQHGHTVLEWIEIMFLIARGARFAKTEICNSKEYAEPRLVLNDVRKIAATALACLEQHGAPLREWARPGDVQSTQGQNNAVDAIGLSVLTQENLERAVAIAGHRILDMYKREYIQCGLEAGAFVFDWVDCFAFDPSQLFLRRAGKVIKDERWVFRVNYPKRNPCCVACDGEIADKEPVRRIILRESSKRKGQSFYVCFSCCAAMAAHQRGNSARWNYISLVKNYSPF